MSTDSWVHPIATGCLGCLSPWGRLSDQSDCSHTMNLSVCWCRCVHMLPHTHVDRDERPAPTAFRNPDKNNITLGNLVVREWDSCRAPTASWEGLGFQLQLRNLPKSCDTAIAGCLHCSPRLFMVRKKVGQITFITAPNIYHLAYAPRSEKLILQVCFFPRQQAKCRAYWYNSQKQSFVRSWEKVWSQVPGFSAECLWSQPTMYCRNTQPCAKTSAHTISLQTWGPSCQVRDIQRLEVMCWIFLFLQKERTWVSLSC